MTQASVRVTSEILNALSCVGLASAISSLGDRLGALRHRRLRSLDPPWLGRDATNCDPPSAVLVHDRGD